MPLEERLAKIIVIGTSAGGPLALRRLVAGLDEALPVAVLIVQHLAPDSPLLLADALTAAGSLPATYATDGEQLVTGHIYLAPPNHHLLVQEDHVRVAAGPRENRARPSIDPLFRSAAVTYGSRTIGVLLTGMLDDGTAGLEAIQRCGGVTIVQEPQDAAYPDMVTNALAVVDVDYRLPLDEIPPLLNRLASEPSREPGSIPEDLRLEVAFSQRAMGGAEMMNHLGQATSFTCPDCGGRLWEMDGGGQLRYRCEVGHAFNGSTLVHGNREAVEEALWVALRSLEERERMLDRLAISEEAQGRHYAAAGYRERAIETKNHRHHLRQFLLGWMQASSNKT